MEPIYSGIREISNAEQQFAEQQRLIREQQQKDLLDSLTTINDQTAASTSEVPPVAETPAA